VNESYYMVKVIMNDRTDIRGRIQWGKGMTIAASAGTSTSASTASRKKGKHASSTQNRRTVWEGVIWPLILEVNRSYFTLDEYHTKRDSFCLTNNIPQPRIAGGFVSLLVKGILTREEKIYSIHYRLIPYMRKKVNLEYGQVMREINTKR
jgi:hypothetical protein